MKTESDVTSQERKKKMISKEMAKRCRKKCFLVFPRTCVFTDAILLGKLWCFML